MTQNINVIVDTSKLSIIVEYNGSKYRYSDNIHDEIELGYIEDRLKWHSLNDKMDSCLTTEFMSIAS